MLMLIWKNIARRRTQSVLTVSITFLTVMVFVMVLGVFQTMNQGLALSRERLGADAILIPRYATADGGDLLFTAIPENIYMPIDVVAQAQQLEGVAAMTPQFYAQTLALSCCEPGEEARIIGYDSTTDFVLSPYLAPEDQGGIAKDELVMGGNFDSDYVGYNYLVLGEKFKVVSQLQTTGTGMDSTIFMDVDTVRDLCLSSPTLAVDWVDKDPHDYISVIMIQLEDGVDGEDFVKQVEASGIDAKCLLTGDTISSLQEQLEVTMQVMFALWAASLLIAVLALTGRFNALAKERKKEIGLLRAIGLKKSRVFALIIGETCTMALMGGILGSTAALMCMNPVIEHLEGAFKLSSSVWSSQLAALCALAGVLLACTLGFAAAVVPAVKSASLDPQTAITQGEVN
ncbi:MAG: FtsX-like permease family protein [Oscillospiraceae bacterium]|nr:FtsX-like permease family protein [Oscillospiraceae bacterium]